MSRVLIVEDNEPLREMLQEVLESHGHDVLTTATPAEALQISACYVVDVILTDLDLSGMSGLDLCRGLRGQHAALGRSIPVWLMTGSSETTVVKQALAAGARGVLRKPFSLEVACTCVEASMNAEYGVNPVPAGAGKTARAGRCDRPVSVGDA